ncbi:MAG TPA: hypothetical protein VNL13_03775 [Sulfolobales archaeon]|nr:hypothetical protein [Sulfolobales archaeon]
MGSDREIDLSRLALALRNLLAIYASGLAILIIYILLLSHGVRLLLGLSSPLRELSIGFYGVILTIVWLYSWWRVIKITRNRLLGIKGSRASSH